MSDLIVLAFDDMATAEEVRTKLNEMQKEHLVDLEDSCVVVRDEEGKIKLHQSHNLTAQGALAGGFWGLFIGLLFSIPLGPFAPVMGLILGTGAVGAAAGAVGGKLSDYGIEDKFIKEASDALQPGTSALFVLVYRSTPDKVLPELKQYNARVLQTSFSNEVETHLRETLQGGGEE